MYISLLINNIYLKQVLLLQSNKNEKEVEIIDSRSFKSERRSWLIIKLKAIKYYKKLLY